MTARVNATALPGVLYVVATPIGNLGDLSPRALAILKSATRLLAEDTRRTRSLLSHLGIEHPSVERFDAHTEDSRGEAILSALGAGESVALVSDAGTPLVSDPGASLVALCRERGHTVVPIPGASAVLAALMGCGLLQSGRFHFFGFVPRSGVARADALARIVNELDAVVLFESADRTDATIGELAALQPSRMASIARELTKVYEEFRSGSLEELAKQTTTTLGEVVIVLGEVTLSQEMITDDALDVRIDAWLERGDHAKTIAAQLAAWSGRPRRDVYERVVGRKLSKGTER
jgi:16S rRNA (cytidine1402-2'-O)-methyltransferase